MTLRYYSSVAQDTALTAQALAGATTFSVVTTTGWPTSYPFTLALEYNTSLEELVDVTGVAGLVVTCTRGVDSTTAITHNAGATVRHVITARDIREANAHVNASSGVHGANGTIMGSTDVANAIANIPWAISAISANTNLANRTEYHVTTSSPLTLTLPVPTQGMEIRILDVSGQAKTNNITVSPAGYNFQGSIQNFIFDVNYGSCTLIYVGTTYGWKVA